ncbi:hypothetical protein Gotur_021189 [Gossypium turneri]
MLSTVEECVCKLEESMEDAKESDNALGESIDDLRRSLGTFWNKEMFKSCRKP